MTAAAVSTHVAQNIEQVDKLFSNRRISIFLAMLAEILVQIR